MFLSRKQRPFWTLFLQSNTSHVSMLHSQISDLGTQTASVLYTSTTQRTDFLPYDILVTPEASYNK